MEEMLNDKSKHQERIQQKENKIKIQAFGKIEAYYKLDFK